MYYLCMYIYIYIYTYIYIYIIIRIYNYIYINKCIASFSLEKRLATDPAKFPCRTVRAESKPSCGAAAATQGGEPSRNGDFHGISW